MGLAGGQRGRRPLSLLLLQLVMKRNTARGCWRSAGGNLVVVGGGGGGRVLRDERRVDATTSVAQPTRKMS